MASYLGGQGSKARIWTYFYNSSVWKNPGEDALDTLFALPGPPSLWVGVNVAKVVFDSLVIAWAVF